MPRPGLKEWLRVSQVVATGRMMHHEGDLSSFTSRFERDLCRALNVEHAITLNSGTSALVAALVGAGVGPGDEVLIPAYTWVSTAAAPLSLGAIPVLVEINETLGMDPIDLKAKITPRCKAVIPVHMLNLVCDMDAIRHVARDHNLVVIEDACQALGVMYKGLYAGCIGDVGAFSFNFYKNISSGEGGAVVTNSSEVARRARVYHDIGSFYKEYDYKSCDIDFYGVNLRVSELTSAVLVAQLGRLKPLIKRRMAHRRAMAKELRQSDGYRISPHNDEGNAAGLTIIFEDPARARDFASRSLGVERIADVGRHCYSDWFGVLECAARKGGDSTTSLYSRDMCARTIGILERTCIISLGNRRPLSLSRYRARQLLRGVH